MTRDTRWIVSLLPALAVLLAAACSGDTNAPSSTVCGTPDAAPDETANPQDIEAQLAAVLLREGDLPEELRGSSLIYSTNEELADGAQDEAAELARLEDLGRLLGVDVAFVPVDPASGSSPVRGGIQSSVSVYQSADGAGQSLREGVEEARQSDWPALYTDLTDVAVEELPRAIGDEGVWFRVTGRDQGDKIVVDDQLVFRVGRARAFLRVTSIFAEVESADQFASQVEECGGIVAGRIQSVFGE